MRKSFLLAALIGFLGACSTPTVDVKSTWNETIANYSMIPLYPMREDVYAGDIRVHTSVLGGSETVDSRFLARLDVNGELVNKEQGAPDYSDPDFAAIAKSYTPVGTGNPQKTPQSPPPADGATNRAQIPEVASPQLTGKVERWAQPVKARILEPIGDADVKRLRRFALPRIEAARVTTGDFSGSGVFGGIWKATLGAAFQDDETLLISLTKLESVELSDRDVVDKFRLWAIAALEDEKLTSALCHAGLRWGDSSLEHIRISLITRAFYARGVRYSFGDTYGAALVASVAQQETLPQGNGVADLEAGGNLGFKRTSGLGIEEDFNVPMAFGVNAATISPLRLDQALRASDPGYAGRNKPLSMRCRELTLGFTQHSGGRSVVPQ